MRLIGLMISRSQLEILLDLFEILPLQEDVLVLLRDNLEGLDEVDEIFGNGVVEILRDIVFFGDVFVDHFHD